MPLARGIRPKNKSRPTMEDSPNKWRFGGVTVLASKSQLVEVQLSKRPDNDIEGRLVFHVARLGRHLAHRCFSGEWSLERFC